MQATAVVDKARDKLGWRERPQLIGMIWKGLDKGRRDQAGLTAHYVWYLSNLPAL